MGTDIVCPTWTVFIPHGLSDPQEPSCPAASPHLFPLDQCRLFRGAPSLWIPAQPNRNPALKSQDTAHPPGVGTARAQPGCHLRVLLDSVPRHILLILCSCECSPATVQNTRLPPAHSAACPAPAGQWPPSQISPKTPRPALALCPSLVSGLSLSHSPQ